MKRALLVFVLTMLPIGSAALARAAERVVGGGDAAAPAPGASNAEPDEEALLRGPARPVAPPPAAAPAPPAAAPAPRANSRRVAQVDAEKSAAPAAAQAEDQNALAIELSTSGFASGSLAGGLFVGGRIAGGPIVGGFLDYGLESLTSSAGGADVTESKQHLRLGAGARYTFLQSADRRVDLLGAADLGFAYQSAEVPTPTGTTPTVSVSASGFSLAAGPGLRFWVHEQIALGYVARLRLTYLSGGAGVFPPDMPTANPTESSSTSIAFDGVFQILGVF